MILWSLQTAVCAVRRSIEGASAIETDYTIDKTTGEYRTYNRLKGKDNADSDYSRRHGAEDQHHR